MYHTYQYSMIPYWYHIVGFVTQPDIEYQRRRFCEVSLRLTCRTMERYRQRGCVQVCRWPSISAISATVIFRRQPLRQCLSDTSRNLYSPTLIFNALTNGKYLLATYPIVLGFMHIYELHYQRQRHTSIYI